MTPQEAKTILMSIQNQIYEAFGKNVVNEERTICLNRNYEALDIAIKALEKQISKKVNGKDEDDLVCGCHKCGEVNALWKMNGDRNRYCGNCGQAIKWE
jgi:hypothetical protein